MSEVKRQGLPIGRQSFEVLHERNKVYVDKTGYLIDLADTLECCFLSRPRRFGKSLMISTLGAMFQGRTELFKGLAAEKWVAEQSKRPSPVLRFDMSVLTKSSAEEMRKSIEDQLNFIARDFQISFESQTFESRFQELLQTLHRRSGKVVVLIDEYDSPIVAHLDDLTEAEKVRKVLHSFYGILKSSDELLRFVMLTGISKFSKLSVFSALNNLKDISMDKKWGALLGFTQQELEANFGPWLDDFAQERGITLAEVLQKMKDYYDGFCFDGEHHVYNPWSVLNCLEDKKLRNYWYSSTTPSLLVKSLQKFGMEELDKYEMITVNEDFASASEIEYATPESFLYQTGYLTIREYNAPNLTLDYPNWEVRQSLSRTYLEQVYGVRNYPALSRDLQSAFHRGDIESIQELFNKALINLTYESLTRAGNTESLYQALFRMLMISTDVIAPSEFQNALGRADQGIIIGDYVYVLEFKVASNKRQIPKKLREAVGQIQKRQYAAPFEDKGRTVLSVAVVVNAQKKECVMQIVARS